MELEIGNAAGVIWSYLGQRGPTTLAKLKQGTKFSDQQFYMGLGWLAREGKLGFTREGKTVQVSLRGS